MRLHSTQNPNHQVSLKEAVMRGLAPDKGLYMPSHIPELEKSFFKKMTHLSFRDLAFEVSKTLIGPDIPDAALQSIIQKAITFDAPLVRLSSKLYVQELFHGPTLAFKDFGARFMAQLMGHFVQEDGGKLYILVATSGDTGGAVASGFFQTPGIEVIILYPSGKVSGLQEKQLTTLGHNITALEVDGTFDDCQAMVKQAFVDDRLTERMRLTSANSINIARLIPQSFYYFRAWQLLENKDVPLSMCVPSGNFGNMTAGLIAQKMGLPIKHFIAATNKNDVVPQYLDSGQYHPRRSVQTLSNAMDVGAPSNFARMLELFDHNWSDIQSQISGYAFSDEETRNAIQEIYQSYDYQIDPHGAVAYLAAMTFLHKHPDHQVVIQETAHPAKFPKVVEEESGYKVDIPERLAILANKTKRATFIPNQYEALQSFLMGISS